MKPEQFILHLNGQPHGRGPMDYMLELMQSYLITNNAYGRDVIDFRIKRIQNRTPYKYDEFTPDQFAEYEEMYPNATFTYMNELPVGTLFHVHNGIWDGKIIERDGKKYIQTTKNDRYNQNGENQYDIDETYSLWISILEPEVK